MELRRRVASGVGVLVSCVFGYVVFGINTFATKTTPVSSIKPVAPIFRGYSQEELAEMKPYERNIANIQTPEEVDRSIFEVLGITHNEADAATEFNPRIPGIFNSSGSRGESFKDNYKGKGVCIDYALMALGELSDNGYPPYVLLMTNKKVHHTVALYRTNEGFGSLGQNHIKPKHKTIESLLDEISNNERWQPLTNYTVVNLDDMYSRGEWIHGSVNTAKHFPDIRGFDNRMSGLVSNVEEFARVSFERVYGYFEENF